MVFGAMFLVLVAGPSHFWFFRWPVRLLPYLFLPVAIGWAMSLSAGLETTDRVRRAVASLLIAAGGAYLAWADVPDSLKWHLAGFVVVVGLTAGAVALATHPRALGAFLIAATVLVLAFQLQWKPINGSFRDFNLPASAAQMQADFEGRYVGNTVSITRFEAIPRDDRQPDAAYRDITIGNTDAIAGVETISTYSGVGFIAIDAALCILFDGAMCPDAWDRLWRPLPPSETPMVDLLRAETIVVQRTVLDTAAATVPEGWERAEVTDHMVRWRRLERFDPSDGRLSDATGPVRVIGSQTRGPHGESVEFERSGPGPAQLTFARLAWPGYVASVDGTSLPVGGDAAGLLTVTIPEGFDGGEIAVSWAPPRWHLSLAALALGVLVTIVTQAAWSLWPRRRAATERVTS
jgi:hypothetical protein